MFNKNKNNKGFTLVELLVVIAIIGILAVVAVPALFKNIEKGKVAELEADISAIRSAALSYYADNGTYPNGQLTGTPTETANKLSKEIEGLSNPFGATYTVNNSTPVNPPAALPLIITNTNKLSKSGFEKLKTDLGDIVQTAVNDYASGNPITINIISSSN